ncbi:MAG: tetratricopeptide repeat protein [Bacteroidales bacterium]|nr:tetratricopeptide repeat protein [Bacteroidales bacterium]
MKKLWHLLLCVMLAYCTAESASAQTIYSGTLRHTTIDELDSIKKEFSEMLNYISWSETIRKNVMHQYGSLPEDKGVIVTPDSVSFNLSKKKKYTFLCADKQKIEISEDSYHWGPKSVIMELLNLNLYWRFKDLEYAKKFADDLIYFQHMKELVSVKGGKQFDSLAVQYRALKVKPAISEEERRYIVQANAMVQSKNYNRAIELYEKAIAMNPTNPMVYNNEALLLALVGQYDSAINRMKKYLMLVPEAEDARAAQDKIYEWEAEIK